MMWREKLLKKKKKKRENGSTENLVLQKLEDYLKLSKKTHEKAYTLGWVSKGSRVRVALACRVPISIGKHYREKSEKELDEAVKEAVKAKLEDTGQKNKAVAKTRRSVKAFNIGDNVMLFMRKERILVDTNSKLQPRKYGPFKVTRNISVNAYVVVIPDYMNISNVSVKALDQDKNSGSSSSEVKETDVGGLTVIIEEVLHRQKKKMSLNPD
ncbi:putative Ty3-gypsy-like retroelement pol polyprotein [Trifolium medium]|uniref:Putative Ty3-gypsy-like retroelement pol polyprotein n=1 Tax=Trifolium medium TaxID=97028 RepID=A0A392MUZ4_9FABA|nr:putative Ty3-gypsy-like retroelement pol polyprotein [Trifolium medium]